MSELPPIIGGYELKKLIAQDGASKTFRAVETDGGRACAVKVIEPDAEAPLADGFAERFAREARAVSRLDHPYIVPVLDAGVDAGRPYVVTEHMPGGSIGDYTRRHGPLSPRKAAAVVRGVLGALDAAHYMGVVHGDLKPGNILVGPDSKPKIANFGVTRLLPGKLRGDWPFVAPEQRKDAAAADARSDIYSAGATLYTLVTGLEPADLFAAELDNDMLSALPPSLGRIIQRATRYKPEDRYQKASDMLTALKGIIAELPREPIGAVQASKPSPQDADATLPHSIPPDKLAKRRAHDLAQRQDTEDAEDKATMRATIIPAEELAAEGNTGEVEEDATDAPSVSQVFAIPKDRVTEMPETDTDEDDAPTQTLSRDSVNAALAEMGHPAVAPAAQPGPDISSEGAADVSGADVGGTEPIRREPGLSIPAGGAEGPVARAIGDVNPGADSRLPPPQQQSSNGPPVALMLVGGAVLTALVVAAIVFIPSGPDGAEVTDEAPVAQQPKPPRPAPAEDADGATEPGSAEEPNGTEGVATASAEPEEQDPGAQAPATATGSAGTDPSAEPEPPPRPEPTRGDGGDQQAAGAASTTGSASDKGSATEEPVPPEPASEEPDEPAQPTEKPDAPASSSAKQPEAGGNAGATDEPSSEAPVVGGEASGGSMLEFPEEGGDINPRIAPSTTEEPGAGEEPGAAEESGEDDEPAEDEQAPAAESQPPTEPDDGASGSDQGGSTPSEAPSSEETAAPATPETPGSASDEPTAGQPAPAEAPAPAADEPATQEPASAPTEEQAPPSAPAEEPAAAPAKEPAAAPAEEPAAAPAEEPAAAPQEAPAEEPAPAAEPDPPTPAPPAEGDGGESGDG